ncbi:MAG: putative toxin-antitoxin system toxin component, PIN family [Terracidiphilus sp.]
MRLVLDTNTVVSALLWEGAPRRLLKAVAVARLQLFTSDALLEELADVLSRRKFKKRIASLDFSPSELFDTYTKQVEIVQPIPVSRLAPDLDDDVVIGTAIAAKADFIVTGDKPLLSVEAFEGGRIVSVGEALEAIAHSASHSKQ